MAKEDYRDLVGGPPKMASVSDYSPHAESESRPQINGRRSSTTHGRHGINLPAVAEVLARYNLDPAVEIAQVLGKRKPVLDAQGKPVIGSDGLPVTETLLSPKDHALLASELLQYTRPKMRAVEVTQAPPELTDEQIDRRLAALLARAAESKA